MNGSLLEVLVSVSKGLLLRHALYVLSQVMYHPRVLVTRYEDEMPLAQPVPLAVAEAPWSVAEWAVAPRFDNPRATVLVLVLG